MSNSFGKIFKITTYGESHGVGVGVIIDGCPAGVEVDEVFLQAEMQRRKPGQSKITTQRKEEDVVEILSGVFDGMTTGTPIALAIRNTNQKSKDYSHIKDSFRPSHADFTYQEKYGVRDYRGGGRSSARETAARVAAGAIAKMYLQQAGVKVQAYVSQVGSLKLDKSYQEMDLDKAEENIVRCPDPQTAEQMIQHIDETRKNRDTIGGIVSCVITGTPVGLGEPVFDKLHAILGQGMLSINAVKGFEYGSGFEGVKMYGSEHNDPFKSEEGKVETTTNHSGGVQGGISNGQDIYFNVAFKPIATIMNDQESIDKDGNTVVVEGKGRHDPCVVPRAVPIVEAMAALTIADFMLRAKTNKI
jgi:chorismate synthase